jgi:hypothetical protein
LACGGTRRIGIIATAKNFNPGKHFATVASFLRPFKAFPHNNEKTPHQGWKPLRDLNTAIATIQPQNLGEAMIQAELLHSWNQLYLTRSSRISAVPGHVPGWSGV